MPISDGQFRAGVLVGAGVLVLGITAVRFCGSVPLPAPPAATAATTEASSTAAVAHDRAAHDPAAHDPAARDRAAHDRAAHDPAATPTRYRELVARDAAAAGLRAPSLDDMARELVYRVDEGRRVLEVGERPVEVAGLQLAALRTGDSLALEVRNPARSALAYHVVSTPTPEIAGCHEAPALPFDAMVIGAGQRETRIECAWRDGMSLVVTRVETIELPALSAFYVAQVPPSVVGIEARIARGHRRSVEGEPCPTIVGQAVANGLESGEIGWRDLVDFYARHRCQTYQFPVTYRAFTRDGAQPLPAVGRGG